MAEPRGAGPPGRLARGRRPAGPVGARGGPALRGGVGAPPARAVARTRGAAMRLTWWGHSTVLVEVDGVRVLADPVLRNRVGPLRRAVPLPAAARPERHTGLDVVLISHLHHDHCDLASLRRLSADVVLAPPGAGGWLRRHGVTGVEELGPGELAPVSAGVTVTA